MKKIKLVTSILIGMVLISNVLILIDIPFLGNLTLLGRAQGNDGSLDYYLNNNMERNVFWLYSESKESDVRYLCDDRPGWVGVNNENMTNLKSSFSSSDDAMIFNFPYMDYPLNGITANYEAGVTPYLNFTVNTNYVAGKVIHFEIRFDTNGDSTFETAAQFNSYTTQNDWQQSGIFIEEYIKMNSIGFSNGPPGNMHNGTIQLALWRTDGIIDNPGTAPDEDWCTIYCGAFRKCSWAALPFKWEEVSPKAIIGPDPDQDPMNWWVDYHFDPNNIHHNGYVINENITLWGNMSYSPIQANIIDFSWDFGDLEEGTGMIVNHIYNSPGIYKMQLIVTDENGKQGWCDHWIEVFEEPPPDTEVPVIKKDNSDTTGTTGDMFSFNISAYDNIEIVSVNVEWSHEDLSGNESLTRIGKYWTGTVTLDNSIEVMTYTIYIRDTSDNYNISSEKTIIVVDNKGPTSDAGADITVDQGTQVTFNGGGSNDNIGIVNYTWSFEYNGTPVLLYGREAEFFFKLIGQYDVVLRVMDAVGNSAQDYLLVIVEEKYDDIPPIANAGSNQTVQEGTRVYFDGSASSDNIKIVNYTWTVNGETLYGHRVDFIFNNAGKYEITLTVRDAVGNSATDHIFVIVEGENDNVPPIADAGTNQTVEKGVQVHFDGGVSSDNVGIVNYSWSINGKKLYGPQVSYTFEDAGEYIITLTVRDAIGNFDSDTLNITVLAEGIGDDDDTTGDDDTEDDDDTMGDDGTEDDDGEGGNATTRGENEEVGFFSYSPASIAIIGLLVVIVIIVFLIIIFKKKRLSKEGEISSDKIGKNFKEKEDYNRQEENWMNEDEDNEDGNEEEYLDNDHDWTDLKNEDEFDDWSDIK